MYKIRCPRNTVVFYNHDPVKTLNKINKLKGSGYKYYLNDSIVTIEDIEKAAYGIEPEIQKIESNLGFSIFK